MFSTRLYCFSERPSEVTGTTPGSRCGPGSVTLAATANSGSELKWYENSTGGSPLFTGVSFATPSINNTTTYYVSPATPNSGSATVTVGAGATTSATYSNPLYSAWSNTHNQHIVLASELTASRNSTWCNYSNWFRCYCCWHIAND
ncbi:MAG: hypothetical protein V9E96_05765 [Chitinophagaceae bacterium]